MREYKIVEYPEGIFKAYKKGLVFWKCIQSDNGWNYYDVEFISYKDAEHAIKELEIYYKKERQKT